MTRVVAATVIAVLGCAGSVLAHDLFLKLERFFRQPNSDASVALINGVFERSATVMRRIACAVLVVTSPALAQQDEPTRPNIVFLLVDDWGWTDAGCQGSDLYETPNIDRLAASGTRFTDAYAACTVCSPTRAAVMTGKYPARLHVTDWISGHVRPRARLKVPTWTQRLEHGHVTIAELLRGAGYRTAHVGKWHLTPRSPDPEVVEPFYPEHHGFDRNVAGNQWGAPGSYHWPFARPKRDGLQRRLANFPSGGAENDYLTDRLTDEALAIVEAWRDEPFFLYLPYYAVHTPLQPRADLFGKYRDRLGGNAASGVDGDADRRHGNAKYAAMVEAVDESVGRIVSALGRLGLAERTVIVLTGDNGGLDRKNGPTDNAPLRSGKGSAYEGGVRVPTIVCWPDVTRPASVCSEPVTSVDWYPTIRSIAGIEPDEEAAGDAAVDGVDLTPVLRDPSHQLGRDAIFWHYPHYHPGGATPYGAVRSGRWRLVQFYEDDHAELYDLQNDIGETEDRAAAEPERTKRLLARLAAWRREVGAQMPTPNPDYDPGGRRR